MSPLHFLFCLHSGGLIERIISTAGDSIPAGRSVCVIPARARGFGGKDTYRTPRGPDGTRGPRVDR